MSTPSESVRFRLEAALEPDSSESDDVTEVPGEILPSLFSLVSRAISTDSFNFLGGDGMELTSYWSMLVLISTRSENVHSGVDSSVFIITVSIFSRSFIAGSWSWPKRHGARNGGSLYTIVYQQVFGGLLSSQGTSETHHYLTLLGQPKWFVMKQRDASFGKRSRATYCECMP